MFCLLLSRIARLGSPAMKDLHFGSLRRHSQSAHSNIGVPQPIRNSALGLFASGRDHCLLHKGVCCSHLKCTAHAFFFGADWLFSAFFFARAELTGLAESITFSGGYVYTCARRNAWQRFEENKNYLAFAGIWLGKDAKLRLECLNQCWTGAEDCV